MELGDSDNGVLTGREGAGGLAAQCGSFCLCEWRPPKRRIETPPAWSGADLQLPVVPRNRGGGSGEIAGPTLPWDEAIEEPVFQNQSQSWKDLGPSGVRIPIHRLGN